MKQLCQNKHTIRFRYWNRKKYAIFYSLGKCVTIGNLKKEIADVSLGKQANVCTAFSVCSSARKEDAGEEYEEGMPPVESMLQMLRTQLPQPQVADVICLFYLNKYCLPERCAMHLFGFFVLILKSATTRLYDTEAKIICIVSKKGAQCIECHHKDI